MTRSAARLAPPATLDDIPLAALVVALTAASKRARSSPSFITMNPVRALPLDIMLGDRKLREVTDAEVLAAIQRMVRRGDVVFTRHAQDRMDERDASTDDVCNALLTAKRATHELERDRWKLTGGTDLVGDALRVVVTIEADVIVVTLF